MKLFLLTAITMVAFASNSILNRWGLLDGETGPAAFQALRVVSGALCLGVLLTTRSGLPPLLTKGRAVGTGSLMAYMLGFSFAYVALDAGVGALILFGGVQVTMFAGALIAGERPPPLRWIGAFVAFGGLIWLLWPGAVGAPPLGPSLMMGVAAVAWGIYSLAGRGVKDPMAETGANFICAMPIAMIAWLIVQDGMSTSGAMLAVIAGAVTSGLGYALWYTVLPKLDAAVPALTQLTVPVIAVVGGVLVLGELVSGRLVLASAVVLGGVALGVIGGQRKMGSKGS